MDENLKKNLTEQTVWVRALYMLVYYIVFNIIEIVVGCVAIVQWVLMLLTGKANDNLKDLGENLGLYLAEITAFLTFRSEEKPYPFSPWPKK